jgi:diaminohydroxyphosphoribosylaminopyrimidine deaminase/5-amino-6-(5-phosphoribosylamino)uracil reductase
MHMTDDEWNWMRRAVDLGKQSKTEQRKSVAPKVGVVIVSGGKVVAQSFRGERGDGNHAEYCALAGLPEGVDVRGATVYTTLEPCSRRNPPKLPCAQRLVEQRISLVAIGMYDPDPRIHREGWRILRDAGIGLVDFPAELRAEIRADNSAFLDKFRLSRSPSDEANFDFVQSGEFLLGEEPARVRTHWGGAGHRALFAYGEGNEAVTVVRHAVDVGEVDDPASLTFPPTHVVTVSVGQVVVFRSPSGAYAVIKLLDVRSLAHGDARNEVRFRWQLRVPHSISRGSAPPAGT